VLALFVHSSRCLATEAAVDHRSKHVRTAGA